MPNYEFFSLKSIILQYKSTRVVWLNCPEFRIPTTPMCYYCTCREVAGKLKTMDINHSKLKTSNTRIFFILWVHGNQDCFLFSLENRDILVYDTSENDQNCWCMDRNSIRFGKFLLLAFSRYTSFSSWYDVASFLSQFWAPKTNMILFVIMNHIPTHFDMLNTSNFLSINSTYVW